MKNKQFTRFAKVYELRDEQITRFIYAGVAGMVQVVMMMFARTG